MYLVEDGCILAKRPSKVVFSGGLPVAEERTALSLPKTLCTPRSSRSAKIDPGCAVDDVPVSRCLEMDLALLYFRNQSESEK
jgi:hypothetical protein